MILLGPCHRVPVRGLALSSADVFRTPLGDVPLDKDSLGDLDIDGVEIFDASHRDEHSLEVHLPFLQTVLGDFAVIPIVVGNASPELVAQVLDSLWGGPETLIVISSDLSHYLGYDEARVIDADTCGATPIAGLLVAARRREMTVTTLDLRNSADTAGDRMSVVGYGAWMVV